MRVVAPAVEPSEPEKAKYWDVDSEYVRDILKRDRERREILPQAPKPK